MNNHYIPRLLLKQFAVSNKVNTYDCATDSFQAKKLKNTFVSKDIFDIFRNSIDFSFLCDTILFR